MSFQAPDAELQAADSSSTTSAGKYFDDIDFMLNWTHSTFWSRNSASTSYSVSVPVASQASRRERALRTIKTSRKGRNSF